MNERVAVMREAVVKLTQMLAGKGIRVTQQGVQAYVESAPDGKPIRVNLPFIPDNATNELIEAIQGFLDHEVAHILFTDFKAAAKITDPSLHSMWNIIEDARIEKAMAQRFTGSGHNISVTGKFFLDKYTVPTVRDAAKRGDVNGVKAAVMVPAIRALAGQQIFREFMSNNPDMESAVADEIAKIASLQKRIENCSSTADAVDVAQEVLKALRSGGSGAGSAPKAPKPKAAPTAGVGSKAAPGKGAGKAAPKDEEETEPPEDEDEEETPAPPEDEEESSAAAPEGEDEEEGEGESEDEDEEAEASAAPAEDDEAERDESEEQEEMSTDGSSSAFLDALDKETANGFDETMSRLITNEAVGAAKGADYLVFSKDDDVIEPLHIGSGYNASMAKDLSDAVDHMVAPLQKDLERAISARSLAVWENGRRSGRMHSGNLSRLAVGDTRVFRKKHESTSKDVAVELVVDMSGSMYGSKIHTAAKAAYALASVLDRLNIKNEVVCFTTGSVKDLSKIEAESKLLGKKKFSRVEPLYMPILKTFNERMTNTETRSRFAWLPHCSTMMNNVDGESIAVAARRLMARREAGKIMIVLSDGAPACYSGSDELRHHLRTTVQSIEKAGVRVVGIGIESNEVTRFYERHMVLHNVSELPARVMKELRALLLN